jgi:hypothetical protein
MQFTIVANPPCQARKPWRASAWSRQCSLAGRVYSVDRSNDLRARDFVDANADLRFNKKAGNSPILIIARIGDAVAFLEYRPAAIWREGDGSTVCCQLCMPSSRKADFWHADACQTPAVAGEADIYTAALNGRV